MSDRLSHELLLIVSQAAQSPINFSLVTMQARLEGRKEESRKEGRKKEGRKQEASWKEESRKKGSWKQEAGRKKKR